MLTYTDKEKVEQKKGLIKSILISIGGLVGGIACGTLMFLQGAGEFLFATSLMASCSFLAVATTYGTRAIRQIVNSRNDKKTERESSVMKVSSKEIQNAKIADYQQTYEYVSRSDKKKKELSNITNEEFEEMLIES